MQVNGCVHAAPHFCIVCALHPMSDTQLSWQNYFHITFRVKININIFGGLGLSLSSEALKGYAVAHNEAIIKWKKRMNEVESDRASV